MVNSQEKNADLVVLNRGFLTKKRANFAKIDRNWRWQTGSKNLFYTKKRSKRVKLEHFPKVEYDKEWGLRQVLGKEYKNLFSEKYQKWIKETV